MPGEKDNTSQDTHRSSTSAMSQAGGSELPPLPTWVDKEYKGVKKEFHDIRGKIMEAQPDREPYMPYCFNSLLAYTNTDVSHYALYKRYEEMPGTYCQRRTAIRITDPEVSWKMDNVLFLSDYELYHKPFAHDEEEEEDEFEDDGKKEDEETEEKVDDGEEGQADDAKEGQEGGAQKDKKAKKKEGEQEKKKANKKNTSTKKQDDPKKKKDETTTEKKKNTSQKKKENEEGNEEKKEDEEEEDEEKDEQEDSEKAKKEKLKKEKEEIQYRKAKDIWVTYSYDYIFEKSEKKQDGLLSAVRKNKKYLKDVSDGVWDKLVSDRRKAYDKMVKWREEQEYALRHGPPPSQKKKRGEEKSTKENKDDEDAEKDPTDDKADGQQQEESAEME
ncbi:DNA ligase 1-like [Symsagittifera roscoffensis]|uniref:DNA ligase 1-like n=1 Tax=Symsagittifera roscoffensis TaxID=84072 RepID=UPI00307C2019